MLTRLPGDARVSGHDAVTALAAAFAGDCGLSSEEQSDLLGRLGVLGVVGGAVYDALAGEAARRRGRTLPTRDRRASRTYDLVGTRYELIG